jgi:hypothetical protein
MFRPVLVEVAGQHEPTSLLFYLTLAPLMPKTSPSIPFITIIFGTVEPRAWRCAGGARGQIVRAIRPTPTTWSAYIWLGSWEGRRRVRGAPAHAVSAGTNCSVWSPSSQVALRDKMLSTAVERRRRLKKGKFVQMTNSKRSSDEDLFSISGAADALQRSRRTISKAMKDVTPDAVRSGLSLWKIGKIIEMVNARTEAPILPIRTEQTQLARDASEAFAAFDDAWETLTKLKTLAARRAAARKMVSLLNAVTGTMEQRDLADDLHPEHASLRAQNVWRLCLRGFQHHCNWTGAEAWHVFNSETEEDRAA